MFPPNIALSDIYWQSVFHIETSTMIVNFLIRYFEGFGAVYGIVLVSSLMTKRNLSQVPWKSHCKWKLKLWFFSGRIICQKCCSSDFFSAGNINLTLVGNSWVWFYCGIVYWETVEIICTITVRFFLFRDNRPNFWNEFTVQIQLRYWCCKIVIDLHCKY